MRSVAKSFRSFISSTRIVLAVAAALMLGSGSLGMMAFAGDAPSFRADVPRVDPEAERRAEVPHKPLQAGIQLNQSMPGQPPARLKSNVTNYESHFLGKARGGAKTAQTNPLRGRTADTGNSFNMNATSGFGIIGVKFILTIGRPPIINRVFAGTPAADVGLSPEDAIIAVDGVPTIGLTKEEVYDLIIGSPGTRVTLSIRRGGDFQAVSCIRMDINDLTDPVVRRDYMMSM